MWELSGSFASVDPRNFKTNRPRAMLCSGGAMLKTVISGLGQAWAREQRRQGGEAARRPLPDPTPPPFRSGAVRVRIPPHPSRVPHMHSTARRGSAPRRRSAAQVERGLPMPACGCLDESAAASSADSARAPFSDVAYGPGGSSLDGQAKQQAGLSDKVSNRQERSHQEAKAQSCREPPAAGHGTALRQRGCRLLGAARSKGQTPADARPGRHRWRPTCGTARHRTALRQATSRFQGGDIEEEHMYRTVQTSHRRGSPPGLRQVSALQASRAFRPACRTNGGAEWPGRAQREHPAPPGPARHCPASTHPRRHGAGHAEVFPR